MIDRFSRSLDLDAWELRDDGRTVEGLVVPYEQPSPIVDHEGAYDEVFARDSFAGMFQSFASRHDFGRVALNLEHRDDLDHHIGFATQLGDSDAGVVGTFRLLPSRDLEKVQAMLVESHRGLSIEFGAKTRRVRPDGCVERRGCNIFAVAATPRPAYVGAGIVSLRESDPVDPPTPLRDEMIARWGFDMASSAPDTDV